VPKYLLAMTYSSAGLHGMRQAGAASRETAIREMCESLDGSLDLMLFAFGPTDVYAVCDLPDDETAAAAALTIASSGAVGVQTTKLLTAADIDAALGRTVTYQPPGH
jgi:uncharacterized protein with GYD domain